MVKTRAKMLPSSRISLDRRRIDAFITRHALAWDISMAVLVLVYLGISYFEDHPLGALAGDTLLATEYAITLIFIAEFSLRFYVAPSRRAYLRAHWIDLIALLPAIRWMRFLRFGRLLKLAEFARLLRLGVLIRFLIEFDRVLGGMRRTAARNGVHVFFILAVCLVVVGGTLVWQLEHTVNPSFHDFADAIWWAFATMTTVGYGNGPSTLGGRAIASVIMVVGIASFGVVTATVTAYFVQEPRKAQHPTPTELMDVLEDIRGRLERLEQSRSADSAPAQDDASLVVSREERPAAS